MTAKPNPKNICPTPLNEPNTEEAQKPATYLKRLRYETEEKAIEAIQWYIKRKRRSSFWSIMLRFITIWLTFIGGVAPLLQSVGLINAQWGQAGYIVLALAATCMYVDKFMGLSSSWMRYITADFALQKALAEFQTNWILMWYEVKSDIPTKEQQEKLLRCIQEFQLRILVEMEQETQMWINEFQSNIAQLQMSTKAKLESYQPGIIVLTVPNAKHAEHGLNVMIDNLTVAHFTGSHIQIGHILPGQHHITIQGIVNGKEIQVYHIVTITPNAMVELKLSLPIEESIS